MNRTIWTLMLCAAVLALVALACCPSTSSTPSGGVPATKAPGATQPAASTTIPEPEPQMCKVGDKCVSGGIALTVLNVSKEDKLGTFWTPDEGKVYLCLEVLIENVERDEEAPHNPMYFSVKDAEGFEYNTSLASKDPSLKSGNLAKGDKARGFVCFEVSKEAKGFVVEYEPIVILGGYKPIRVDLGI